MLELRSVSYRMRKKFLVKDVDLLVNDGEIVGLMGASGSGKTCLLRVIAGQAGRHGGKVVVQPPVPRIPVSGFFREIPENMEETLGQFLLLARIPYKAFLRPFSESDRLAAHELTALFELGEFASGPIGHLSGSLLRRALLAHAFGRDAHVLVLDEPSDGLDLKSLLIFRRALARYVMDEEKLALIASQDITFLCQVCDRIVVLDNGAKAAELKPNDVDDEVIKKYLGVETVISRNIYNGRPEVHLFPEE